MTSSFDYATIRVVPRVEREEFVNAGVVVFCLELRFLAARAQVDEARLRALWPEVDVERVRQQLAAFEAVCRGDADAGPIARLSQRERFHWLVAPRSTNIQTSAVHTGVTDDPQQTLEHLAKRMFERD
ncbi:MAG TPA: DUF3037 domain-containing protein [Granulicella sp.]